MSVRGVWMWPESIEKEDVREVVRHCFRAGFTDLFFLTKGLSGKVSFHSSVAPGNGERDLLAELLPCAHSLGLRVHAWLTATCDDHYKLLHPESGRFHYTRGRDKGLISLYDEGYRTYMERLVGELCRKYDIDGLHLDYIRYNHLMYGWDDNDLKRYAAAGADLGALKALMELACQPDKGGEKLLMEALRAQDPSVQAFARTRREDVRFFAQALCTAAGREKDGLIFSAALMPEGAYEDTAFADLHYGQSYADAARLMDWSLPMAYSLAYGRDGAWVRSVTEGALRFGNRFISGLHAYDGATAQSLRLDLAALRGSGCDGFCLFRWGTFVISCACPEGLAVYNPLELSVTRLALDDAPLALTSPIPPHTEMILPSGGGSGLLRAFSDQQELCVYQSDADLLRGFN